MSHEDDVKDQNDELQEKLDEAKEKRVEAARLLDEADNIATTGDDDTDGDESPKDVSLGGTILGERKE